ncbi:MAG TPA: ABC transporter substrate-binding protein [Thermoleophilia bacterium]|nr:ABC transporter substrate-binding protein [Thermoleophilia bacterium]
MPRAFKLVLPLALVLILAVAGVAAGCGSSDTESDASPSADTSQAYSIGISQIVTHPALDATVQGFQDALMEAGYTNVTYDLQNAEGDMATTASIAQKFAGDDLDLVLGVATPTAQALVKQITDRPVLFTAVTDPVGAGLVEDPNMPSANVTGVSDMQPVKPILELAQTFRPDAKNVGMVYNAGESNSVFLVEQAEKDAGTMGLTIVKAPASTSAEVQAAAKSLIGRVDAIAVIGDNTAVSALEAIIKVCDENDIPLVAGDPDSVKRGAVACYGFDYYDLGKQTGVMAAQILGGAPVDEVPVQFAENLQLSINEKAATAQGVTIPDDLVAQAVNKY